MTFIVGALFFRGGGASRTRSGRDVRSALIIVSGKIMIHVL
jgi:hypothetical protein